MDDMYKKGEIRIVIKKNKKNNEKLTKRYAYTQNPKGKPLENDWNDIPALNSCAYNRLGDDYYQQKNIRLFERMILMSKRKNEKNVFLEIGLDFGGMFVEAAINLGCNFIRISENKKRCIDLTTRLKVAYLINYGPMYEVLKECNDQGTKGRYEGHEIVANFLHGKNLNKQGDKGIDFVCEFTREDGIRVITFGYYTFSDICAKELSAAFTRLRIKGDKHETKNIMVVAGKKSLRIDSNEILNDFIKQGYNAKFYTIPEMEMGLQFKDGLCEGNFYEDYIYSYENKQQEAENDKITDINQPEMRLDDFFSMNG